MNIALGGITLEWKPFKVNLDKVCVSLKALDSNCCGLSGQDNLRVDGVLPFSEESTVAIKALWDSITEGSELTLGYMTSDEIKEARQVKLLALADKPFADFTPVDKKIWLGLPVTNEELI